MNVLKARTGRVIVGNTVRRTMAETKVVAGIKPVTKGSGHNGDYSKMKTAKITEIVEGHCRSFGVRAT